MSLGQCVSLIVVVVLSAALLLSPTTSVAAVDVLLSGGDPSFRSLVENRLSRVLAAMEQDFAEGIAAHCTEQGEREIEELLAGVDLTLAQTVMQSKLLELSSGDYEVRDLPVEVTMGQTPGSPKQYLVFNLTPFGKISGVRFSVDERHYRTLIPPQQELEDLAYRQTILQFVELYRTAYNRKDVDYIERVFADDALIIVGRMVKTQPDQQSQSDIMQKSGIGGERIRLLKRSKSKYLSALRQVFARNDFLDVEFENIKVTKHKDDPYVYGVTLVQKWRSSTYRDEGYLFLLIDFVQEWQPKIYVRSWQSEPFSNGEVIDLDDFVWFRVE